MNFKPDLHRLLRTDNRIRRARQYLFLKEILLLSLLTFGGAQAHLVFFLKRLVQKGRYLSEEQLLELYALCQMLPGPTSTQTLAVLAYLRGGARLTTLTMLIWCLPATLLMTAAALFVMYADANGWSLAFTKYVQPVAVGLLFYAAFVLSKRVIKTKTSVALMLLSAVITYLAGSPWILPVVLLLSGAVTALLRPKNKMEAKATSLVIPWRPAVTFFSIIIVAAVLGSLTGWLPVRLFENFYRNGSLVFGGGQVLVPLLYTEFVDFKHYLGGQEFLSGLGLSQMMPGPTYAFTSYVGALAMRQYGWWGAIGGGLIASVGIFLPGTLIVLFFVRFWEKLRQNAIVQASLEGVHAASAGLIVAAGLLLLEPLYGHFSTIIIIVATVLIQLFTKVPVPFIMLAALLAGIFL